MMITITKEKEVNKELLESALTIVIKDDIIKPRILTAEERVIGNYSGSPEVEYNYKDKMYRLTLLPDSFLDSTIATVAGIIRFQASKYFIDHAGDK